MDNHLIYSPLDEALFKRRIVLVDGPVTAKLSHRVNKILLAMEADDPERPITLHINSPGGEVSSGFAVYDTARFIQPTVKTLVVGLAASMGSIISLAATREHRYAFPNSKFLIHQPLISGTIYGQASDLEIRAKDILKTREKINRLYSAETGRSVEDVAKMTERDHWMTAEEAKALGLIAQIVQTHAELPH